jgi:hypothetical protein
VELVSVCQFVNAQQAKQIYRYKNIKEKLYKTKATVWYNTVCKHKQLTPNYIFIKRRTETSSTPTLLAASLRNAHKIYHLLYIHTVPPDDGQIGDRDM